MKQRNRDSNKAKKSGLKWSKEIGTWMKQRNRDLNEAKK